MFVTTSEPSISSGTVHEENIKLASPEAVYSSNITFHCCEQINGFYVLPSCFKCNGTHLEDLF